MHKRNTVSIVVKHIVLGVLAAIWLIPILWLFVTSFKEDTGISISKFFPQNWSTHNFVDLFKETEYTSDGILKYKTWFMNTLVIAIFTCLISTTFVLMVSYSLSFCRFKGRRFIMNLSMILNMFPGVLSMIVIYFLMKALDLTQSHIGMIIVYSAGSGLGYLIVKGYMDTISTSIREAAIIDGCTEAGIFFKVVLPLCKPIIVYQVISSFLMPWGDFVFAKLILGTNSSKWTLAIGLYNMLDKSRLNAHFTHFCAGGLLISVPISILFLIMQKYYVEGITSGSNKE